VRGISYSLARAGLASKVMGGRGPATTVGEAALLGHHLWIRCQTCRHVAVILPAVIAIAYALRPWRSANNQRLPHAHGGSPLHAPSGHK
jgi:hypothetical protein